MKSIAFIQLIDSNRTQSCQHNLQHPINMYNSKRVVQRIVVFVPMGRRASSVTGNSINFLFGGTPAASKCSSCDSRNYDNSNGIGK